MRFWLNADEMFDVGSIFFLRGCMSIYFSNLIRDTPRKLLFAVLITALHITIVYSTAPNFRDYPKLK